LNLVGDFGGGGMLLAFGVAAALLEAARSGQGQVVDAAMVDGAASLSTMLYSHRALGIWEDERGVNILDTGAPFYEVYDTADGKYFSVGAIESQFYAALIQGLGLDAADLPHQMDRSKWPETKERFESIFRSKTRDEWAAIFDGVDACATPVLSPAEANRHPHVEARSTFFEMDGAVQPSPAPRFSRTPGAAGPGTYVTGEDADAAVEGWGIDRSTAANLREVGALA
ncbi:MAG: CoA transferase, partial [Acidimicrobiales bacterium]